MKFNDLDKKMRVYEESIDQHIMPGMFIVARVTVGRRHGSFPVLASTRAPSFYRVVYF